MTTEQKQTNNEPIAAVDNEPAPSQIVTNNPTDSSSSPDQQQQSSDRIDWHHMTVEEVLKKLALENPENTLEEGLTSEEVELMRAKFGPNTIPMPEGRSLLMIIFANFVNVITLILGAVFGISIWLEDWIEVGVVLFVIIFNGVLGTVQEYGAEKSASALKKMTAGTAKLRRDGHVQVVDVQEVVVGDIVILDQGAAVPADIRLIDVSNLQCAEDALTGEAHPISKVSTAILVEPSLNGRPMPVGDRKNMTYRQTSVVNGSAVGIVVTVGAKTELGKITSSLAADTETETPLQASMRYLMYWLLFFCGIVVIIVFGANRWDASGSTIIYACAVAIGVLPEALVAIITVAFTVSMKRMAELKCIVRKLNALEVLASVTDICSDKTGTLTQNVMTTRYVQIGSEKLVKIDAQPRSAASVMTVSGTDDLFNAQSELQNDRLFYSFVRACALNASCELHREEGTGKLIGAGNPSEIAIQAFCYQTGLHQHKFRESLDYEHRGTYPFDSTSKMMTVGYYHVPNEKSLKFRTPLERTKSPETVKPDSHVFVKGAPEKIMAKCTMTLRPDGTVVKFTDEIQKVIEYSMEELAKKGLRCIAIAERAPNTFDLEHERIDHYDRADLEKDLIFLGLTGIYDPPRVESSDAVRTCQQAGIRVRMCTGDHLSTATVISSMIGIVGQETDIAKQTINGPDLDHLAENGKLSDIALEDMPLVVGRCSPLSKVHMVKALQAKGCTVLMTGDGFNDCPSIKAAEIGCSMGSGTDATKSVAELIITDDNFATIVRAIAEGRRIRSVISKFIIHLLTANVAEVIALVIGLAIQIDERSVFVISPIQILWLNTFTGVFPAIGLTADDPDPDLLLRPPSKGSVIDTELIIDTFVYGTALGICTLVSFLVVYFGLNNGPGPLAKNCNEQFRENCEVAWRARTTAWIVLYVGLLLHGYNVRHARDSVFTMRWFDNAWLYLSLVLNTLALLPMIYIPVIANDVFYTNSIGEEWGIVVAFLVIFMIMCEVYKLAKNFFFPLEFGFITAGPKLTQETTIVLPRITKFETVDHMTRFIAPIDRNLSFTHAGLKKTARNLVLETYSEMASKQDNIKSPLHPSSSRRFLSSNQLSDDGISPAYPSANASVGFKHRAASTNSIATATITTASNQIKPSAKEENSTQIPSSS